MEKQAQIANAWWEIREQVTGRFDQLTNAEWRELFITLNLEVHVNRRVGDKQGKLIELPNSCLSSFLSLDDGLPFHKSVDSGDEIQICFGLPASVERVIEIVSSRAGARYSY